MKAGVDIFRINFSHADYDLVRKNIEIIRELNKEYGYSVGILGDSGT
jgi:pyruvate kinase